MEEKIPPKSKGIKRLIKAFGYTCAGFAAAFKNEAAFRQEIVFCAPLAVLAFVLNFSLEMRCMLILSMLGLLIAELLNSAAEACVDLASPKIHPLAKRAKDMASAAVFTAIVCVALAWCFALYGLFA